MSELKHLEQVGIDIRQSGNHLGMREYIAHLENELKITRDFYSSDRPSVPLPQSDLATLRQELAEAKKENEVLRVNMNFETHRANTAEADRDQLHKQLLEMGAKVERLKVLWKKPQLTSNAVYQIREVTNRKFP